MGLEELKEQVALYRCDRCYKTFLIEKLTEDPETPGILVCKKCRDKPSFELMKANNPKTMKHYFR